MASKAQSLANYTSRYFLAIGKQLYLNEEGADVHFVFDADDGHSTRIPAHKNLLTATNEVFRVMFNGLWEENNEVKIVDASIDAFKDFLQFFYFTDIKLTMRNIGELIYLGKKYNVADCLELCTKFLRNTLNEDNVCDGYRLAINYENEDLKNFCEAMIGINTNAVFTSEGFLKCDPKVLSHIVKLEKLSCTEPELFEACVRRADVAEKDLLSNPDGPQIDIRGLVKDFRFGSMSLDELAALGSSHYKQFSYDEYRDIVHMISSKKFQPTLLNGVREKRIDAVYSSKMDTIECNRLLSTKGSTAPYFIKEMETTTFSTNQPIILKEIFADKIYGRSELNQYIGLQNDLPTEVTIVEVSGPSHSGKEIVLYNAKSHLKAKKVTAIALNKPIFIKAGFKYEIRMKQSPPPKCCAPFLLNSEVQIEPDLIVQFYNDPNVDGDKVARGLISNFEFIKI